MSASSKEGKHAESPPKVGLQILRTKVRELFTCGEGISIPRVRHKGRQPLIKCAKS